MKLSNCSQTLIVYVLHVMTGEVSEPMTILDALTFVRQRHSSVLCPVWYREVLFKLQNRLFGEMRYQSQLYSWIRSTNVLEDISKSGVESVLAKIPLYVSENDMKNTQLDDLILETVLGVTNLNFAANDIEAVVRNIVYLLMTNFKLPLDANGDDFVTGKEVYNADFKAAQELTKRVLNRGKL